MDVTFLSKVLTTSREVNQLLESSALPSIVAK